MAKQAAPSIEEMLETIEFDVLSIKQRLAFLSSVQREMAARSKDGRVRIGSDALYQLVYDSYEKVVIDMASLSRSIYQPGGFVPRLNNHLKKLGQPKSRKVRRNAHWLDEEGARLEKKHGDEAYRRLFPDGQNGAVTQQDVKKLGDRIDTMTERVRTLRHEVHAHRFEKSPRNDLQSATIDELSKLFEEIERILNDVRLLALNSTFAFDTVDRFDPVASDFVDLMIHGNHLNLFYKIFFRDEPDGVPADSRFWYPQARDAYYESEAWKASQDALDDESTE